MGEIYSSGSWTAKEGEEDQFVQAWTRFAEWLNSQPGSGTARLTRHLSEPRRYMSFADWESEDAMNAWRNQPEFPEKLGAVREHVDDFTPSEYKQVVEV